MWKMVKKARFSSPKGQVGYCSVSTLQVIILYNAITFSCPTCEKTFMTQRVQYRRSECICWRLEGLHLNGYTLCVLKCAALTSVRGWSWKELYCSYSAREIYYWPVYQRCLLGQSPDNDINATVTTWSLSKTLKMLHRLPFILSNKTDFPYRGPLWFELSYLHASFSADEQHMQW